MRPWSVEECAAYAKQLRDKSRANTAEHAAQAIEYLLKLAQYSDIISDGGLDPRNQFDAPPQRLPLTDEEIYSLFRTSGSPTAFARAIEAKHGIGSKT